MSTIKNNLVCSCLLYGATFLALCAQELNCQVKVAVLPQLNSAMHAELIEDMERNITQLLNQTNWTNDMYSPEERLHCELTLSLTAVPALNNYRLSAQVLLARPVYGTSYESVLLNYADTEWEFEYMRGQPLRYQEGLPIDELTGLLAFYAYLLLGVDADSFAPLAGTPYFQRAQRITTLVPSAGSGGWSQFGSLRNRYWLVQNLLDSRFTSLRTLFYEYHRHGMDLMADDPQAARAHIFAQLQQLQTILSTAPTSVLGIVWLDSKYREFIALFSEGPRTQRAEVHGILTGIDPTRTAKYAQILEER